jgi:hypothetical protein
LILPSLIRLTIREKKPNNQNTPDPQLRREGDDWKIRINAVPDLGEIGINLSTTIDRIILGPSSSSPLARDTIIRMVENLGRADLKDRIISSTIPFRAG